ncbi:ROK family protein [Scopulibacillus cellulosilyticus]|uniref:ROK family protein n=1 Tax=Scopulibacillus cellulosilyticus TaxID=2665665 RepID=A0ABW2PXX3_9BACL
MPYSLGVDIGGTKIAAGIVDEKGKCLFRTQHPSISGNRENMYQQVVRCIKDVVDQFGCSIEGLEGIGIGVPGKVDTEKGIAVYQNNLQWADFPIKQRILEQFPVKKVVIDNDVYMAAFAEWIQHGQEMEETFVYLTISTGISCCTIHNGTFIRGSTGFAGEIGMLPVAVDPLTGERLPLETMASGPAIERLADKKAQSNKNFISGSVSAIIKSCKQIIMEYRNQEPYALEVMNEILDYLAKGLYTIICILDPNKLVLGGGVINHNPELIKAVKDSLQTYLISEQADLLNRIYPSILKGDAGLIGAGLRIHEFFN